MMKLGSVIRQCRKEKGLSLKDLSLLCGISVAQISKLETGKSQPSVNILKKLSEILHVPMTVFTMTDEIGIPDPVRVGEGFTMRLNGDGGRYEKQILLRYLTIRRDAKMQPIIVTLPVGCDSNKASAHPGDEFCYILEGRVLFLYGAKNSFEMSKGDFIYYEAGVPHMWKNIGDVDANILTCNTPPVI
jgi:transcriptional regulator with XRE-family HTH domain